MGGRRAGVLLGLAGAGLLAWSLLAVPAPDPWVTTQPGILCIIVAWVLLRRRPRG